MIKITEKTVQALLLDYTMQSAAHRIALPNVTPDGATNIVDWETDLLSVNKSRYSNEYEIKLSRADYLKDRLKERKRMALQAAYDSRKSTYGLSRNAPNYFWYVTHGFEIEPPPYAGWIKIEEHQNHIRAWLTVKVMKRALLLHTRKVSEESLIGMGRLLAYRLSHAYRSLYMPRAEMQIAVIDEQGSGLASPNIEDSAGDIPIAPV